MMAIGEATGNLSISDLKGYKKRFDKSIEEAKNDKDKKEAEMYSEFFAKTIENKNIIGDFEDFGETKVEKAGKTITVTLTEKFSKRDANLVFVYRIVRDKMELNAINFNPVYSKSEILGKAGLNVLMGMLIVFAVLIIISLIIYCFRIIPYLEQKKKKKSSPELKEETLETFDEEEDDLELIAVIAAAIAEHTGKSTDDFVVRKIKRR
jgi:sodium pump decarboxylase gamma subunit